MPSTETSYSPIVLLYLQIGEDRIRLADVLYNTATLYESVTISHGTSAYLILSVNGVEAKTEVVLHKGITSDSKMIEFLYSKPEDDRWLTNKLYQAA